MGVSNRYILEQGPVLGVLAKVALGAARQAAGHAPASGGATKTPGPEIRANVSPRPPELLRDYVRHVGGDPSAYRGRVPAHFFPQWGFPLQARTLEGISYPMHKVLNAGCRIEMNAPLPAGKPLVATATLVDIDDNGRRAVLNTRIVTGTAAAHDALVANTFALVPLSGGDKKPSGAKPKPKARPQVPNGAREIAFWRIGPKAGLDFAKLTGDFNPLHWVPAYARASGFRNVILHGFSTMARAIEGLNRAHFSGDVDAMKTVDVQFTRPLILPARVGLYLDGQDFYVGDAPGGPAYLTGSFTLR